MSHEAAQSPKYCTQGKQAVMQPLTIAQMFNARALTAEECAQADKLFQAMHQARCAASQQPLNQLVRCYQSEQCTFLMLSCK